MLLLLRLLLLLLPPHLVPPLVPPASAYHRLCLNLCPGPDATAICFPETRFLNLGGRPVRRIRFLRFPTLDPLRLESDILDCRSLGECAALFPSILIRVRRGRYLEGHTRVCRLRGLRWFKVFAPKRQSRFFRFLAIAKPPSSHRDHGLTPGIGRHLCSESGVLGNLLNSSDPGGVGISIFLAETAGKTTQRGGKRTYQPRAVAQDFGERKQAPPRTTSLSGSKLGCHSGACLYFVCFDFHHANAYFKFGILLTFTSSSVSSFRLLKFIGLSEGPRPLFVPGSWPLERRLFVSVSPFHGRHVREFWHHTSMNAFLYA